MIGYNDPLGGSNCSLLECIHGDYIITCEMLAERNTKIILMMTMDMHASCLTFLSLILFSGRTAGISER